MLKTDLITLQILPMEVVILYLIVNASVSLQFPYNFFFHELGITSLVVLLASRLKTRLEIVPEHFPRRSDNCLAVLPDLKQPHPSTSHSAQL